MTYSKSLNQGPRRNTHWTKRRGITRLLEALCPRGWTIVKSNAQTVDEYLTDLPADRKNAIVAVRKVILEQLPEGYEESMQFGMIGYVIPLATYPKTYNGKPLMYAALASQKNYMSVYLMNIYADQGAERWFTDGYRASGKKLDMGKSCVRFKSLDDLPMELIGKAVARTSAPDFIALYEASRRRPRSEVKGT